MLRGQEKAKGGSDRRSRARKGEEGRRVEKGLEDSVEEVRKDEIYRDV